MNILQTPAGAVGLAFILGVTLIPGAAPGAKPSGNVVYVDNVNGNDANPGTSAEPKATIQAGEDAAEALYGNDGTVIVRGGGPAYAESVTVSSSTKFYGNRLNGNPAHPDPLPLLQGGFYASGIGAITVTGFDIRGGLSGTPDSAETAGVASTGSGVFLENVATVTITGNKIGGLDPEPTAAIWAETTQGSSQLSISGNDVIAGQTGIYFQVSGSASIDAKVEENSVADATAGSAITVTLMEDATGNFTGTKNTLLHSVVGITLLPMGNSTGVFTTNDNLVMGNAMGGINVWAFDSSTADFSASSNVVQDNTMAGIFVMAGSSGTLVDAFLSGNSCTYNHGDQIGAYGIGTLNFISDGARSNDLRQTPENVEQPYLGSLYDSGTGTENGFIFINHDLHPANTDLP